MDEEQNNLPTALSETDKAALDLAGMKKQLAQANMDKCKAELESAEVSYRYLVLQLFQKYQLSSNDAIDAGGNFHRNINKG